MRRRRYKTSADRYLQAETKLARMNADSPSEIAWLTKELARVHKRAAELSAMLADKLRKLTEESAVLPEQPARATGSHTGSFIDTWIPSAAPVAADATTTLALGNVGAFLDRDGSACSAAGCNRHAGAVPAMSSDGASDRARSALVELPGVLSYV